MWPAGLQPAEYSTADIMSARRTAGCLCSFEQDLQRGRKIGSFGFVKEFLEFVIRQLVEFPDEMMLSEIPSGKTTIFRVQLRQTDVGRIIGRNGQTIQAIRALLASSAARHGQRATLEIVE
jgi:predicted RNA-binding protein YlqC (UPF0109 family)